MGRAAGAAARRGDVLDPHARLDPGRVPAADPRPARALRRRLRHRGRRPVRDRVHRRPAQAGAAAAAAAPATATAGVGATRRRPRVPARCGVRAQAGARRRRAARDPAPEGDGHSRVPAPRGPTAPLAIQAEDLKKSFRIPTHRVDSLKERVVRPFASREYRELQALDGVSFDIRQGEFFGIVGRNGSGKSTLLKLLASIYRADAGTIRMAGRLAPFIELGRRLQPGADRARERRPQRGDDGPHPAGDARPPRRRDRVRRTGGIRRPEAEELLLGDAGPARLLGDAGGRRRRPPDRRGAGGRRRRLPAEVRRRLPRDESAQARRSSSSPTRWRRSRSTATGRC